MLCEIKIENVAVIEKATVNLGMGLNVLTGETGAGKSILIDSINAILGSRTSKDIVRTGTQKACIWATFSNICEKSVQRLQKAGYEANSDLLLYREITHDGKSNCRINGMPATAAVLRDVCSDLIHIHGQHDNQSLMNVQNHIHMLNAFAQNDKQHKKYYEVYRELCKVKREIDALSMDEDEKIKKIELLRFQCDEIIKADLKENEEEVLREQVQIMMNSQRITQQLNSAYNLLSGDDDVNGASELLGSAANALDSVTSITSQIAGLSEKLNDLFYQTKEIASELNGKLNDYNFDEYELEQTQDRLDLIYKLKQKYKTDIVGILNYAQNASEELNAIELGTQRLDELYDKQTQLYELAKTLADELTLTRLSAFEKFNKQISSELAFLNMPGINFTLQHKKGPLAGLGQDTVEFYICTNPGEAAKPLAKIASGGELSRIMLAVKSAMADKDDIQTIIYDEIDTGVSGLAAARIGNKLKQTANGRQIICITHTAQIAAEAHKHLLIKKNVSENRTYTQIHDLEGKERIKEIARMISGDNLTDLALANAREMLELHEINK